MYRNRRNSRITRRTLRTKLPLAENVEIYTVSANAILTNANTEGVSREQARKAAQEAAKAGNYEQHTKDANDTGSALHQNVAALLNFNNETSALPEYDELEFGIGTNPTESGCSEPIGRIDITDPSNEADTFFMREYADEYELNPPANPDNTIPELTEMAAYSEDGEVYNYLTLSEGIKKSDDYVLIANLSMKIGG